MDAGPAATPRRSPSTSPDRRAGRARTRRGRPAGLSTAGSAAGAGTRGSPDRTTRPGVRSGRQPRAGLGVAGAALLRHEDPHGRGTGPSSSGWSLGRSRPRASPDRGGRQPSRPESAPCRERRHRHRHRPRHARPRARRRPRPRAPGSACSSWPASPCRPSRPPRPRELATHAGDRAPSPGTVSMTVDEPHDTRLRGPGAPRPSSPPWAPAGAPTSGGRSAVTPCPTSTWTSPSSRSPPGGRERSARA